MTTKKQPLIRALCFGVILTITALNFAAAHQAGKTHERATKIIREGL